MLNEKLGVTFDRVETNPHSAMSMFNPLDDFELNIYQKAVDEIKHEMTMAHGKTDESLRFLKENLFNPHEGLWAETKSNSAFRESTTKWRGVFGVGFVALIVEKVWSIFTGG